jgi:hypothetical protein
MLLILDNLETLLTPDGQWRDPRWALLIGALIGHTGPSRVIITSRVVPAGLDAHMVLIRPVPALSRDESLLLVAELPTLRALLHSVALARCLLTLTQGHPQLLEFADAAAADPPRLAYQLAEIEAAVDGAAPLAAFLVQGNTWLDAAAAGTVPDGGNRPEPGCHRGELGCFVAAIGPAGRTTISCRGSRSVDQCRTSSRRSRALPDPPWRRRSHPHNDPSAGHFRRR